MLIKLEKHCETCNTLLMLLESEKANNRLLMDRILQITQPQSEAPQNGTAAATDFKPIKLQNRRIHQQMLEEEDRKKARTLNEVKKNLDELKVEDFDLEKELKEVSNA